MPTWLLQETVEDQVIRNAREAVRCGLVCVAAGDRKKSVRWFRRAHALAPNDPAILYLLASALTATDPAEALIHLRRVIGSVPSHRSARISEIAALHRLGQAGSASAELSLLLQSIAVPEGPAFFALASDVARNAGYAGWAGLTHRGDIIANLRPLRIRIDTATANTRAGKTIRLAKSWRDGAQLHITSNSGPILGAQIDIAAITRIDGVAVLEDGATIAGWAMAPNDPDAEFHIEVFSGNGGKPIATCFATDDTIVLKSGNGAQLPRGFRMKLAGLKNGTILHVTANGKSLAGSPLTVTRKAAGRTASRLTGPATFTPHPIGSIAQAPPATQKMPDRAPIAIVLPLPSDSPDLATCLRSLHPASSHPIRIVVVTMGDPSSDLRQNLDSAISNAQIQLLTLPQNAGIPAAVAAGIDQARGSDVVLLTACLAIPPGAIDRLANTAYGHPRIGSVTAPNQAGSIVTCHAPHQPEASPNFGDPALHDQASQRSGSKLFVDIPAGVGPCTLLRHDCLSAILPFRTGFFSTANGALEDFALRAAQAGWRHVAACDIALPPPAAHLPETVIEHLLASDRRTLNTLHPGYDSHMQAWLAADPRRPTRDALALDLWNAGRRPASVILVTHDSGGGVERALAESIASISKSGKRPIVLRPRDGILVADGADTSCPTLHVADIAALARTLRADNPTHIEFHHTANYKLDIVSLAARLKITYDIIVHDFAAACPRVTFSTQTGRYCGEPIDTATCESCIRERGARTEWTGTVAALRKTQAKHHRGARTVVVPTADTARRIRRYFPDCNLVTQPWEDDGRHSFAPTARQNPSVSVVVVGALGLEKGYDILLACARDAASRALKLAFTVVGHTIDDQSLHDTGCVFVTGRFEEGHAQSLIAECDPRIGFIPSIWPETWCYALSELWLAKLRVAAFDLGGHAERIRTTGAGTLLPLGLPPNRINDALIRLSA